MNSSTPEKIKATGSYFYKYTSFAFPERLQSIILNHEIYVPSLNQLNDPADGRPQMAVQSDEGLATFLIRMFRQNNPQLPEAALMHEENVIRYNIPRHGAEKIQRMMSQILNTELQGYRIYSMSKRPDNTSLWAKYADEHRGYCLEFKHEGDFFNLTYDVTYCESILMDVNNREHTNGYWFLCKRPNWSNEEEVRVVMIRGNPAIVPINPSWLSRIILGWKMPDEDRKKIREWAAARTPELKVATAAYDEFKQSIVIEE